VDGKYLYFDLPFTPTLIPVGADRRELPLLISQGSRSRIRTDISLPPEFRRLVIAPPGKKLTADGAGTAKVTASAANGQFQLTDALEVTPAIVAPADYPALLKAEAALREKSARAFLLEAQ
jgi:hypothetical protein